jgi:hypothetical protein
MYRVKESRGRSHPSSPCSVSPPEEQSFQDSPSFSFPFPLVHRVSRTLVSFPVQFSSGSVVSSCTQSNIRSQPHIVCIHLKSFSQQSSSVRMAFDLVPPPPPTAPLSYSPPSEELEVNLDLNVFEPIKEALATALRCMTLYKNPSTSYYVAANLHNTLFNEKMAPIWELFPSQPSTPDIILAQLQAIRAGLSGISPTQDPHPTDLPDTVALATLGRKIDELKVETKTSLKSFAEAVKAPTHQPPPLNPSTKPKPKNPQPPPRGERLPQAVIRFQGRVDAKSRPSFTELVPLLNSSLRKNDKFSHVKVVGVKWTPVSNLVVRAQAPSPSVLVAVEQRKVYSIYYMQYSNLTL